MAPVPTIAAAPSPFAVQIGVFAQAANAQADAARAELLLSFSAVNDAPVSVRVVPDGAVYRVLVNAGSDRLAAQQLANELNRLLARPVTLVSP